MRSARKPAGLYVVTVLVFVTGVWLIVPAKGQSPSAVKSGTALKTPWGAPDLNGIWDGRGDGTPLERNPKYGTRELLTEQERAELVEARRKAAAAPRPTRDDRIHGRGNEQDVNGGYNIAFTPPPEVRPTKYTSLVVDPPDGRLPSRSAESVQRGKVVTDYVLALLQATNVCKDKRPECKLGTYGPPSPRYDEVPPFYVSATLEVGGINRAYNPEDWDLRTRCLSSPLPGQGTMRIVQSPRTVTIFYEGYGQGQVWSRVIPITNQPHLPPHMRFWGGDSRARWEGDTLVVDVTNFDPRNEYPSSIRIGDPDGSRGNLHLIERFKRVDVNTILYHRTVEDPTVWTKPYTIRTEFSRLDDRKNDIFYEPRCHEGNYALMNALSGARDEDKAFAKGTAPHPATKCISHCGGDNVED